MLEIKEKNLDRREWYTDSDRDFTCVYHKDEHFEGGIGLITFTGVARDEVDSPEGRLCIADRGYQWLELAPKDGNYTLTAMFHEGELFQHYVDITLKNEVDPDGDARFYDLFLDVVISQKGIPHTIDTEELDEALASGIVTHEQYDMAVETADEVVAFYKNNFEKLCKKLFEYKRLLETS
ncbi:DUF402 domain-containing protein [Butyrivibrio sp. DSM 10294]|uniref:DUF402 domain-containing protein n=1 Tax=Butyrivibrio sp. DSM 10294 TaxID=2972457 RepID=UPI00234EE859|nr:DUF402 domain-containing protein [Butyrivibrio sp. DSM 10294]MDC7293836.1 DUF402 domain-containing protein [Butyrivibrio sp. DSM 10294]